MSGDKGHNSYFTTILLLKRDETATFSEVSISAATNVLALLSHHYQFFSLVSHNRLVLSQDTLSHFYGVQSANILGSPMTSIPKPKYSGVDAYAAIRSVGSTCHM